MVDSDKNVWFTEYNKDQIGRFNPITGYMTEYQLPTFGTSTGSNPFAIAKVDAMVSVFFTEYFNNKIGQLDPTAFTSPVTVNTITSATSASASAQTTNASYQQYIYGKRRVRLLRRVSFTLQVLLLGNRQQLVSPPLEILVSSLGGAAITTMSTFVRLATSTQTTFTETVFVLPTSTTASTTSTFSSTSTTTTTVSPTLTTMVQTITSSTSTTESDTFSSVIQTNTVYTTIQQVFTNYVTTTTQTNFAATSYRFSTVTVPTLTQYSTSTIGTTTTTTASTQTLTSTSYVTSTSFTTVTAGAVAPFLLLLGALRFQRSCGGDIVFNEMEANEDDSS